MSDKSCLTDAQEYLRNINIIVGSNVHVAVHKNSYDAVYLGLVITEHDVLSVLQIKNKELLNLAHYSRLSLIERTEE